MPDQYKRDGNKPDLLGGWIWSVGSDCSILVHLNSQLKKFWNWGKKKKASEKQST